MFIFKFDVNWYALLHVFDQFMSHKTEFYKIRSMTCNSWFEIIFEVLKFSNTLIFDQNLDVMQKIRKFYKELYDNQKWRLKRKL